MDKKEYRLRYLPLFFEDVNEKTMYIKKELSNPQAANDLIDAVENAILERLPVCESFEQFHSRRDRIHPYYRIYVKNYTIYYVVIEDEAGNKIMEVRRLLYKKQNRDSFI